MSRGDTLQAFRVVGGIVPPNLPTKIQEGDVGRESLTPAAYHLASGENLRDAASRAWQYLRGAYTGWRQAQDGQPGGLDDTRAQLVRERWLLVFLRELGYGQVPAAPGGVTVDGHEYPVSHRWGNVPVHLLGPGVDLDRRNPGVAGAARQPQAMVQELLNRTDDDLWAILSNGRRLRLLRDSTELAGSAYLEFDLEAIFDGELFAEFFLLWQMAHVSRLEKRGGVDAPAADCWLEMWRTEAVESGVRLLDRLRDGVQDALEALGTGFIRHPDNRWLVETLRDATLSRRDYQRALLRLVYRLLFLFVAEDRDALLNRDASPAAQDRYVRFFGTARLRRLARIRSGGPHGDLWEAQALVLRSLGGDGTTTGRGEPALGLPALSGLFDPDRRLPTIPEAPQLDLLLGASLSNHDFLTAVRSLGWGKANGGRVMPVDYRNLGAEELGSVYESLLELEPSLELDDQAFMLKGVAGNERKKSGSYYTPSALVSLVLDEALDPLLDRAVTEAEDAADAERRLLALTVCDPACGSGHFLVAAARRIAQRVAAVRSGDDDPGIHDVQHAVRDVVSRCIYGVDLNDLAAELAKVSLWLEALEPGKPLSVLDANIRVGNSLLGVTPKLLADGIPDEAFKAIEGDDKKAVTFLKKQNSKERSGQGDLFTSGGIPVENSSFGREVFAVITAPSDTLADVHAQADRLAELERSAELEHARLLADTWCAAFVQSKTPDTAASAITYAVLEQLAEKPENLNSVIRQRVEDLAREYRFFHWQLEFPHIFAVPQSPSPEINEDTGWAGGFSCVIGNPPWETVQTSEKEFFAARAPEIANAPKAATRKKLIAELRDSDPSLYAELQVQLRRDSAENLFVRGSGRYPLCARGKINTYSIFAEHFRTIIADDGRMGIITPTGLATGDTTSEFFRDVVLSQSLAVFYDFANHKRKIFEGLKGQSWFAITVLTGGDRVSESQFAIDLAWPDEAATSRYTLAPSEITLLNPNTGTLPLFHSRTDAEITLGVYSRHPVLIRDGDDRGNPWALSFRQGLFNMASDSGLFRTADDLTDEGAEFDGWAWTKRSKQWLPLYEGKMLGIYNDRFGNFRDVTLTPGRDVRAIPSPTVYELADPKFAIQSRYWVAEDDVAETLAGLWDRDWLFGWRDITNVTNERTFVPSVFPRTAAGDTFLLAMPAHPTHVASLQAVWSSLAFDYVSRQKLSGTHMKYFVTKQLACPAPSTFEQLQSWSGVPLGRWVLPRVLELSYTSWRIGPYAADLGDEGPPFRWLPERRERIRAELDAAMMHVYGVTRPEVEHILDSFSRLCTHEERDSNEFRTKRLVLEIYDAMAEGARAGAPYTSTLDPAPGSGPRHAESARPDWVTPVRMSEERM